jgi:dienelactone hydrolase
VRRVLLLLFGVALLVWVGATVVLARRERSGPLHAEFEIAGGVPATLYLPEPAVPGASGLPPPPPRGERPPAVVLAHGFASDHILLSGLARRLAQNGYAVLAIDLRGHGANRNPIPDGRGRPDWLFQDLSAAVEYLRGSPYVDGSRIALIGHSMGAFAALDFATRDSGLDGVVAISGAQTLVGPYRPANVLFLFASADPPGLQERATALAADLAGTDRVEDGKTYGDLAHGTAVRLEEVPGVNHLTIVFSTSTASRVLRWLDAVFRVDRASEAPPDLTDRRLAPFAVAMLGGLVLLAGVGWTCGGLSHGLEERPARGGAAGLLILAAGLLLAMAVLAVGVPAAFLSLEVGDVVVSLFAVAGGLLLCAGSLRARPIPVRELGLALGPGAAGAVGVYFLLTPLGVVGHRTAPTAERLLVAVGAAVLLLPFFLAFEAVLRRGGLVRATVLGVSGRILVVAALVGGVRLGVIPPVVMLMVPTLAVLFLLFEVFASGVYAASRNWLVIAVAESSWLAWLVAILMPLRAG